MSQTESGGIGAQKSCAVCGRRFGWRRRWAERWADIRHCSPRCARRRLTATDESLEHSLLQILSRPGAQARVSPNDAARALGRGWRALSERARDAARRLAERGQVEFVQGDRVVDASSAKGPVQVRLAARPPAG